MLIPRSSWRRGLKTINDFVNPIIDQALFPSAKAPSTNVDAKYTFLHALVQSTQDRQVLRDQIVAVLLAGRDTTASALTWTFFELSHRPDIVQRLRSEIAETIGMDTPPTYTDLKNMKYLQVSSRSRSQAPLLILRRMSLERHSASIPPFRSTFDLRFKTRPSPAAVVPPETSR